jgi:hypothetical protein
MQTTGDIGVNKDPFTSKYMVVDKVVTSDFSNIVWGGNGLLPLFQIQEETSYNRGGEEEKEKKKKDLSHLLAIKQGISVKKLVEKKEYV